MDGAPWMTVWIVDVHSGILSLDLCLSDQAGTSCSCLNPARVVPDSCLSGAVGAWRAANGPNRRSPSRLDLEPDWLWLHREIMRIFMCCIL